MRKKLFRLASVMLSLAVLSQTLPGNIFAWNDSIINSEAITDTDVNDDEGIDFSSKRLLVGTNDSSIFDDETNVLREYGDAYLLGDENPDDYAYVRWYVSGTAGGNQPFKMYVEDSIPENDPYGSFNVDELLNASGYLDERYGEKEYQRYQWRYNLVGTDYDPTEHEWTYTNAYTEGWIKFEFSTLDKEVEWKFQDSALESKRDGQS